MREKYGTVYSMKVGSFKLVVAEDPASVKEVLVKKSADYAGRPPFHSYMIETLGKLFNLQIVFFLITNVYYKINHPCLFVSLPCLFIAVAELY